MQNFTSLFSFIAINYLYKVLLSKIPCGVFKCKTDGIALLLLVLKIHISNLSTESLCNQDSQDILSKNNGSFITSAVTYMFG